MSAWVCPADKTRVTVTGLPVSAQLCPRCGKLMEPGGAERLTSGHTPAEDVLEERWRDAQA